MGGVLTQRGGGRQGVIFFYVENILQRKSGPGRHEGRAFCSSHYSPIIIIVHRTRRGTFYSEVHALVKGQTESTSFTTRKWQINWQKIFQEEAVSGLQYTDLNFVLFSPLSLHEVWTLRSACISFCAVSECWWVQIAFTSRTMEPSERIRRVNFLWWFAKTRAQAKHTGTEECHLLGCDAVWLL
jgi:hypothetical protein